MIGLGSKPRRRGRYRGPVELLPSLTGLGAAGRDVAGLGAAESDADDPNAVSVAGRGCRLKNAFGGLELRSLIMRTLL